VPQLAAEDRVACFSRGTRRYLVWTTDIGMMLAVVTGTGSPGAREQRAAENAVTDEHVRLTHENNCRNGTMSHSR